MQWCYKRATTQDCNADAVIVAGVSLRVPRVPDVDQ
jgi:hypothetical protein